MKELLENYLEKIDLSKTLVLLTVCGSFLFLNYVLAFVEIPANNKDIIHILIGSIDTAFTGQVVSWYYGSSKGSAKKTELIDKMVDKPKGNQLS